MARSASLWEARSPQDGDAGYCWGCSASHSSSMGRVTRYVG
jgi:hypothetical protein